VAAVAATSRGLHPETDLSSLAQAARRAVGADVVLIARWPHDGPPWLAAADGLQQGEQRELHLALEQLAPDLDIDQPLSLSSLSDLALPGVDILEEHGFGALLAAMLKVGSEPVGAIYALKREHGRFTDEGLIGTFARQAAIAVAHRSGGRRTGSLAKRIDRLEALDQMVLSTSNFEELMAAMNMRVAPIFGAATSAIMVWDEQREILRMVAGSFGANEELTASYQISASNSQSNAARVFTTGHPYLSNDAAGDPGILQDYVDAFQIHRLLSVPLKLSERPIGILHLANKSSAFTLQDVRRAEVLAPRVAIVVELARTVFTLRRQQLFEGILSSVAVAIASGESVQDFLSRALDELCVALEATTLALVPDGSPPIVSRSQPGHDELERIVLSEAGEMPGMRAYVVGPRMAGDPGWAAFHVPVQLGRQRVGTLAALRARGEPFTQDERDAVGRLANLAALAWASERYQQQRAELARLEERQRIADDLHDDVAQILFGVQLQLDAIADADHISTDVASAITRARQLLIQSDSAIRSVIHQLSRPIYADLAQRLTIMVSECEAEFRLPIHLEISRAAASAARRLGKPITEAMLKVARESLNNAAKHAGPCRVLVQLALSNRGRLLLTVVDDGVGSADGHSARRHGLTSLRRNIVEHGGTVRLHNGPTGGWKVTASIPL
jgi:signal transduction histidine kinase